MSQTTESSITKQFSLKRVIIPILLGLLVTSYLLYNNLKQVRFEKVATGTGEYAWVDGNNDGKINTKNEADFVAQANGDYNKITYRETLNKIQWTWYSTLWLFVSMLMMLTRDLAYMYRIRVLTDGKLTWRQSFDTIMLWEFASSITPSVVGGSGIAMFILNREKISMGKSTAVVLATALLDEFFYISIVPIVLLVVGTSNLFPVDLQKEFFGISLGTRELFWTGYAFILLLTTIISLAIIFNPKAFKSFLVSVTNIRWLKKYQAKATETGDELITTSKEFKDKPISFWLKALAATYFSWTARYWVVNFMILAFLSPSDYFSVGEHFLIYARQLAMWVIVLISPTPGGSGIAEFAFSEFLVDFIPLGLVGTIAILWRLFSYYPYLFIGSIILPRWLNRTGKAKAKVEASTTNNSAKQKD